MSSTTPTPATDDADGPFVCVLRRLEKVADRAESRFGRLGAGLVWAAVLMAVAAVYVTPAFRGIYHGALYAELASSPFAPGDTCSLVQRRILTPAIAHVLGLTGSLFIVLPLLMAAALLVLVYLAFRREGFRPSECVGAAALIAFSSPLLFLLHFPGYVDTTTYVLVYGAMLTAGRPLVWPILFAGAVLNHDSALLLMPWMLIVVAWRRPGWKEAVAACALLGALLFGVGAYESEIERICPRAFSRHSFLNEASILLTLRVIASYAPWGIFEGFKLFWFLPIAAAAALWQRGRMMEIVLLALPVTAALAQLIIASDTSRLMGLAFPAILLSLAPLRERWGPRFGERLWALILLNFLVPQYYVGQNMALYLIPLPVSLLLRAAFGVDAWSDAIWLGK